MEDIAILFFTNYTDQYIGDDIFDICNISKQIKKQITEYMQIQIEDFSRDLSYDEYVEYNGDYLIFHMPLSKNNTIDIQYNINKNHENDVFFDSFSGRINWYQPDLIENMNKWIALCNYMKI